MKEHQIRTKKEKFNNIEDFKHEFAILKETSISEPIKIHDRLIFVYKRFSQIRYVVTILKGKKHGLRKNYVLVTF